MLSEIDEAIKHGGGQSLERAAHSLKGAVGNFGASSIAETSFELEQIGSGDSLAPASEAYSRLEKEVEELATAFRELVEGGLLCVS